MFWALYLIGHWWKLVHIEDFFRLLGVFMLIWKSILLSIKNLIKTIRSGFFVSIYTVWLLSCWFFDNLCLTKWIVKGFKTWFSYVNKKENYISRLSCHEMKWIMFFKPQECMFVLIRNNQSLLAMPQFSISLCSNWNQTSNFDRIKVVMFANAMCSPL